MKRLDLKEITAFAEDECMCCTRSDAAMYFQKNNRTGKTDLCYVKDHNNKTFIVWMNDNGEKACLPLFKDDTYLPELHLTYIAPLNRTAFLYHKRSDKSGTSYMAIFENDDIIVRKLKMFSEQYLVENYCVAQNIKPICLCLCNVYDVRNNRYITACWSIRYENSGKFDDNGNPQRYETLLTVDSADADILQKIGIPNIKRLYLFENDVCKVQGKTYRVLKDENGKFFLTKDLFTPYNYNYYRDNLLPEDQKSEKRKCKIIKLRTL